MKTYVQLSNEPGNELKHPANVYVASHRKNNYCNREGHTGDEMLADWCDPMSLHSPQLLELPDIQLAKAVVRAKVQSV